MQKIVQSCTLQQLQQLADSKDGGPRGRANQNEKDKRTNSSQTELTISNSRGERKRLYVICRMIELEQDVANRCAGGADSEMKMKNGI